MHLHFLSVLVCVVCVGVCYYITTLIETQQEATKPVMGPAAAARVQIKLDVGFYLLIFAGTEPMLFLHKRFSIHNIYIYILQGIISCIISVVIYHFYFY